MSNKHTPGPWLIVGGSSAHVILDVDGDPICTVDKYPSVDDRFADQQRANAQLISAAPEMYGALIEIRESLLDQLRAAPTGEEAELIKEDLSIADAAIDAATGVQS